MILTDVDVLVHADAETPPDHAAYRAWLHHALQASEPTARGFARFPGLRRRHPLR